MQRFTASLFKVAESRPILVGKELLMVRFLILAVATIVLASTAGAANPYIWIDDAGVDYDNTSLSRAYIGFDMREGGLVVRVDDQHFEGALPAIDFDVPDLATRKDFFGNDMNADMSNIPDMLWLGVNEDSPHAAYLVGFEATHLNTSLDAAIRAYEAAFRAMGFNAQVSSTAARSVRLATFSNGEASLDARFHAAGGDVAVTLRTN